MASKLEAKIAFREIVIDCFRKKLILEEKNWYLKFGKLDFQLWSALVELERFPRFPFSSVSNFVFVFVFNKNCHFWWNESNLATLTFSFNLHKVSRLKILDFLKEHWNFYLTIFSDILNWNMLSFANVRNSFAYNQ